MRCLIVDPGGNGLDVAVRAQRDGHEVKLFIRQTPKTEFIGKGFVERVPDFKPWLRWADLVFNTDNTYYLRDLDAYRKEGGTVIGPSVELAEWELDREVGMLEMRKHGIDVPPYVEFNDYDKAIAHVKKHMRPFVSKPSGEADKTLSYVSKGPADMVFMLERWKKLGKIKSPFIMQERVDGIEMAVGAWVGVNGFASPWCENFEFKKLCNGDLGCQTGEQGTVLRYVDKSKLAKLVLQPFEATLVKAGYVGYIDVNCIIDEDGNPWPLEFTMRPGWPTLNIQEPLHDMDFMSWLKSLTQKGLVRAPHILRDLIAIGVVLSVPDYPYSQLTKKEVAGIPIYGMTPSVVDHVHPCEMMMINAPRETSGRLESALLPGTAGDYVLVMTAIGSTVLPTAALVYRRLKSLEVPNSPMYRTDIGKRLKKNLPELQSHGFATGMEYSTPQAT